MADVGQVNTNLYQPLQPPNQGQMQPLDVIRMIGGLQENQIRQRNMDALQGISGAYSRHVSPTGETDVPGLRGDIARNGGVLAGEGLSQATANSDAEMRLRSGWQQTLRGIYGQLATQPDVTDDDLSAAKVAAAGADVPPGVIQQFVSTMPRVKSAKDQDARRQWFLTQSNLARGPETTAVGVTVPGPKGENRQISAGTAARGMAQPGGLQTGMPPGFNEAQVQTGAGSGAALNDARQRGLNYRQEVFPLETAIPALEKLGPKGSGPGTETTNHLKSFLISNVPGVSQSSFNGTVEDYDKAKKYLTDFVNQNGNTGTNDKLAAAFAGNPSVGISNAAAVDVAKSALALRRMKQAQLVEFEKSGLPDSEFAKWASRWQINHDPRAFGFDLMTVPQRNAVLNSISDKKLRDKDGKEAAVSPRDLFQLQIQAAHDTGLINPGGLTGGR
jgi:hypothetical protein